jgi:hypothetical protein
MNNTKQQENMDISMDRADNVAALVPTLTPNETKLFYAISSYMNRLRRPSKEVQAQYYDMKELRQFKNENLIVLSPKFIFDAGILTKANYSSNKNANYEARKIAKSLIKRNVLYKMKSSTYKDLYLINPMYIYWGSTFGDCYINYCDAIGHELHADDPYLHKVYVEYHDGAKTYPPNPIVDREIERLVEASTRTVANVDTEPTPPECGPEECTELTPFEEYMYSRPSEQHQSPYFNTYSMLMDQYQREQRGLPVQHLLPKVPYQLNAYV